MRVVALSVDRLLPAIFHGRVVAANDRTLSIRTSDDDLVTLAVPGLCNGPNRARLDLPPTAAMRDFLGPCEGATAERRGQLLRVGPDLEVDLAGAELWPAGSWPSETTETPSPAHGQPSLGRCGGSPGRTALQGQERKPWGEEPDAALEPSSDRWPEGRRRALRRSVDMAEAAMRGDESAFLSHARSIVGLGPGLTPSGDDLLVGFLAAGLAWPDSLAARMAPLLRATLPSWLPRTGFVSGAYLRFAVQGRLDEAVSSAASALSAATRSSGATGATGSLFTAHCSLLLKYGHTSGEDIALGILLGLGIRPDALPWEVTNC